MDALDNSCMHLDSPKITKRRQSAIDLKNLLANKEIIDILNSGENRRTWDSVYNSVQKLIRKEADKCHQDESKAKTSASHSNAYISICNPLLTVVLSKANSGEPRLSVTKLVDSVFQCLYSEYQKKYFGDDYIIILVKHVLPVRKYWGQLTNSRWQDIYYLLKDLCNDPTLESSRQSVLRGLYLTLKWGSLHSSLTLVLRQEFSFVNDICLQLNLQKYCTQQEIILQLLISFCTQLAKDCRMASCKLGEEIAQTLIELRFENNSGKQSLFFDFMLLQVRLHHPNGAAENSSSAYAYNSVKWKIILRSLYSILCNEVDAILRHYSVTSGNSLPILRPNLLALFVEVSQQVFYSGVHDVTQIPVMGNSADCSLPLAKRPRLEIGIAAIISTVQTTGNWPWFSILAELISTYPDLVQPNEFATLLEILASLQTECKDSNTRHYLYKLLTVMVQAQEQYDATLETDKLDYIWAKIWETALRSVGLNQNEETTHKLLQSMIHHKKTTQSMSLFSIYSSGVLNISIHSINTLNILCKTITIPEFVNDIPLRKYLIILILGLNNEKLLNSCVYSEKITAQVLTGLMMKSWPYQNNFTLHEQITRDYKCIEDSYYLSSFEGDLIYETPTINEHANQEYCLMHYESFQEMRSAMKTFLNRLFETNNAIDFINGMVLILHFISELLIFNILTEENWLKFVDVKKLFQQLYECTKQQLGSVRDQIPVLKQVEMLFALKVDERLSKLIRNEVSVSFVKLFFDFLDADETDGTDDMDVDSFISPSFIGSDCTDSPCSLLVEGSLNHIEKVQLHAMRILSLYCCVPDSDTMNQNQVFALKTLCKPNSEELPHAEFEMTVYFIKAVVSCKPGTLDNATVSYVLRALQKLMLAKHTDYDAAILLLQLLKDSFKHVDCAISETFKENALSLLNPFYERRTSYGPYLSVIVADCIGEIAKYSHLRPWPNSTDMIVNLLHFLKSDYQDIRFVAIKNLLNIFSTSAASSAEGLQQQNMFFQLTCTEILESFTVSDNLSADQAIDEAVNRTASALHAYAAVIVSSPVWRKQFLFAMIQLVNEKKINTEIVQKVLSIIGKKLNLKNVRDFMDMNLNYLITQWNKNSYALYNFPFSLFECQSDMVFYLRYLNSVVPILLQESDKDMLKRVCHETKKSLNDVVKDSYPNIIAQYLPIQVLNKASIEHDISRDDIQAAIFIFKQLDEIFSPNHTTTLITEMLDKVYIELLNRYFDRDHFESQFGFVQILPKPDPPFYNKDIFFVTLNDIENKLPSKQSIIAHCIQHCPSKLEQILLNLTIGLHETPIFEEKLISLHRYSVLVDYIIPELQSENNMKLFLIRSITYNIMNIIKSYTGDEILLSIAACRYFKTFSSKCLSYCSTIFEKILILIINTLVPIAKLNSQLSEECIIVLNFFIIENSQYLYNAIGSLDPFPDGVKFAKIQEVYEKIKYGNDKFTLEQEIVHFLNAGNSISDRSEGLQHIKVQLSEKKFELTELYANLHKMRGFCEDCEESILHRLICMLVKLTASPNPKVSLEAARCLGELGPADLTTLVLKPEGPLKETYTSPAELVIGQIIVLLSQNLVNYDIQVAKTVSHALYTILASKEGGIVIHSPEKDYGSGILEKYYVTPFIKSKKCCTDSCINIDERSFIIDLDRSDLWCPPSQCSHFEWITVLVCELLQTFHERCVLRTLIPVCKAKVEFSEQIFPLIIYLLLCQNKKPCTSVISKQIGHFFNNHYTGSIANSTSLSQASINSVVMFNRASVQCMLNVVHFIRLQQNISPNKKIIDELDLNYLHVAQGAQFCSAHFTSILYAELWCYGKIEDKESQNTESSSASTLDYVCGNEHPELATAFENLMRESYKKIGEFDAMQGCGISYLLNTNTRVEYYKNLGRWDNVLLHYDSQLSCGLQNQSSDLIRALKNNSLHYLASNFSIDNINTQYECAWRLGRWNITDSPDPESNNNFEKYHYFALKALHENDNISMNQAIVEARKNVIQSLSHASLESSKNLYNAMTELQLLQEIENFSQAKIDYKFPELFKKWELQNIFSKNEFDYIEPIKTQRIVMLNDIYRNDNTNNLKLFLANLHLQLADEARTEGVYPVAQRSLTNLSFIENLTPEIKGRILFEQAQLSWLDDKTSGRHFLRHLLDHNKDSIPQQVYAVALKLYGNWMVETRSENPSEIIEKYFEKSLEILDGLDDTTDSIECRCTALDSLARFADTQYQQLTSCIESSVFESKVQSIKKLRALVAQIQRKGDKSIDEKRAEALYLKQSNIDETEVNNVYKEKNMYLILAVSQYIRMLEQCDTYNLKIFRVLSLSLDNKTNKDLIKILKQALQKIATYKYIPLVPQLVPHIGSNQNDLFEKLIHEILEKCAVDHPHHTLPVILALADSYKDRDFDPSNNNTSSEVRVQTAKELLAKLKKKKSLASVIKNMELVSTALVSLAYLDSKTCTERKRLYIIPSKEAIKHIRNMHNVLLPTLNIEVRKSCNYDNIVGIQNFSENFSLVGGINAPKKISCLGTDGILRSQLIKGRDDLRQDAVMQQVFTIMNTLLARNKQTRKLLIRTYKVVPLSQRSGIIEWCENTEPLSVYLTDAHKRYHPSDWTPNECRNQLKAVHTKDYETKYRKFKQICTNFRPIFHMFFISSYPQPTIWFERRRAYMHSVATSSMVGYILGLGDRHVQNILLDTNTAEVIHIDFGIAFEQGRVLPTPETVPFRLSRDIEAGMGICGIEGVFRRSCEKTMHVLRQNSETVITILEVLLYDPLYVWTITAAEAYSRQKDEDQQSLSFSDDDTTPVNVTAERVLLRLKKKLQGTENGSVCSVEGQVEWLIQEARDLANLSRLYFGWQSYL